MALVSLLMFIISVLSDLQPRVLKYTGDHHQDWIFHNGYQFTNESFSNSWVSPAPHNSSTPATILISLGGLKTIRGFYIRNLLGEAGEGGATGKLLVEFSETLWPWAVVHVQTEELDQTGLDQTQYFPVNNDDMKTVAGFVSLTVLETSGDTARAGLQYFAPVEEGQVLQAQSYEGKVEHLQKNRSIVQ